MNILKIIKSSTELSDMPFLIVFKTIQILDEMNLLKEKEEISHVESA